VSEDIVEFLVQNTLQVGLQNDTVETLKLASCLPNKEFNSTILSIMIGVPAEEVCVHEDSLIKDCEEAVAGSHIWPDCYRNRPAKG